MKMQLKTWEDLEQLKCLNIIWSQGKGEYAQFYLDIYVGGRSFILSLFVETTYLHCYLISLLPWDILSRLFGSTKHTLYRMKGILLPVKLMGKSLCKEETFDLLLCKLLCQSRTIYSSKQPSGSTNLQKDVIFILL